VSAAMERSGKFLPLSEFRRLTAGSLESRLEGMATLLREGLPKFFGSAPIQVISTYEDGAVVFAQDMFHRVKIAAADDGVQSVVGVSPVAVTTYNEHERDRFAQHEAQEAVSAFMRGDLNLEQVAQLASLVESDPATNATKQLQVVETALSVSRQWKKTLTEQREQFEKLRSAKSALQPKKYIGLSEGAGSGELSGMEAIVKKDVSIALARLESLTTSVEKCVDRFESAKNAPENIAQATAFAVDLLDDLRAIKEHSVRAAESVCLVECLGKLRDVVVDALPDYQLAASFVEKVASRLPEIQ